MSKTALMGQLRKLLPLIALFFLSVFFSVKAPRFLSAENLFNIARQQSVIMLIAFGMTLVIIAAEIDLSVGSVAAFSGMTAAWLMQPADAGGHGLAVGLGVVCGIGAGILWGLLNGILVGVLRLPSFVATLGTMGMARGLTLMRSEVAISAPPAISTLAEGMPLGLPTPLWLILLAAVLCYIILAHTVMGRSIYAVGGNRTAARFAGIDARIPIIFVFALSGALTGLASMIEVARLSSAESTTGESYPLDAIAAVVIGGGSLLGGEGSIAGTIIGALVIAVLRNGLDLQGTPPFKQMVYIGALVISAVALDQWRRRRVH